MPIVERIDEYGRGAWIALIVLGFWVFWPLGLATLAFVVFSGRGRCRMRSRGHWHNTDMRGCGWGRSRPMGSGNAAFDEYKAETIRRLEEEQKEFVEYLEKLRQAKDRAEFEQFMADRRGRGSDAGQPSAA